MTSDPFTIADLDVACEPDVDCIGDLDDGDARSRPSTRWPTRRDEPVLTMSLTAGGIDCDDYEEQSGTLTFNVTEHPHQRDLDELRHRAGSSTT